MYRYAQLDENNEVIALSELNTEIDVTNMIFINGLPYIDFRWRYIDGEWLEPLPVEEAPILTPPDNTEIAQMINDLKIDLLIAGVIDNV